MARLATEGSDLIHAEHSGRVADKVIVVFV